MGGIKNWAAEMMEGGLDLRRVEHRSVCRRCVQDEALAEWVKANATERSCDYCEPTGKRGRAAPVVALVRFVDSSLSKEYEDAEGALGLDDEAENGFFGGTDSTFEVVERELALSDTETPFIRDLVDALGDRSWCKLDPYGPARHELLSWSWRDFRETTLHHRRYFFREDSDRQRRPDDETPSVEALLAGLMRYCRRAALFRVPPAGTRFYRCQPMVTGEKGPYSAGRMGPPPAELAKQSNRMSPAGIPMFYGAEDSLTSLVETMNAKGRVAIGRFDTLRPITLLDLSKRPPTPSLFEEGSGVDRSWARFLGEFLEDFRKPISRDGAEHIEYVPTQIVAEYIAVFGRHRRAPVDGIVYASARRRRRSSVVLFAQTDDVAGDHRAKFSTRRPWLEMSGYRERVFDPAPFQTPKLPRLSTSRSRRRPTSTAMGA